ncbi:solute carrier family 22 member 13 isoform X1 [Acipenser oxyrinchus oxyrinchus]|uniref:Solute carrier family 22 member 13 isoform X1 n=1 Tax=Acipenser oxyrinchus oxyrinchus TaxID=40147 RepID=A0AAD8LQ06_ACIOX|nr:solute carrier family 22 member 13 isoform X1 [Acipenser oxyrinchus oxyrinchus]
MSAFIPHVIFHLIARLIVGITCCGINISSFSLGVEWSVPKYHMWPPALLTFASAIGMMLFAGIASLASDWLQFSLAISVPQIVCLPIYFYIPESPRWLTTNKRFSKLEEYRRSKEDSESLDLILNTIGCEPQNSIKLRYEDQTNSVLGYFKSGTILLRLCIMSCVSLASAQTYCGISYNVGSYGVNIYLGQFFSGLAECPLILMPFLLSRFGRRPFSVVSLLLSGTACLLSLLISEFCAIPALVMTLALIGKLCVQVSFCVSLLYSIELFPTVMRQKCVGFVFLWHRIGVQVQKQLQQVRIQTSRLLQRPGATSHRYPVAASTRAASIHEEIFADIMGFLQPLVDSMSSINAKLDALEKWPAATAAPPVPSTSSILQPAEAEAPQYNLASASAVAWPTTAIRRHSISPQLRRQIIEGLHIPTSRASRNPLPAATSSALPIILVQFNHSGILTFTSETITIFLFPLFVPICPEYSTTTVFSASQHSPSSLPTVHLTLRGMEKSPPPVSPNRLPITMDILFKVVSLLRRGILQYNHESILPLRDGSSILFPLWVCIRIQVAAAALQVSTNLNNEKKSHPELFLNNSEHQIQDAKPIDKITCMSTD